MSTCAAVVAGGAESMSRAAYFLPVMATLIAMAIVWGFMLDPRIGAVNFLLKALGFKAQNFLNDRHLVLFTLCAIGVWQSVGFNMVLFMAGLTAIPPELYEAASVDGARDGARDGSGPRTARARLHLSECAG